MHWWSLHPQVVTEGEIVKKVRKSWGWMGKNTRKYCFMNLHTRSISFVVHPVTGSTKKYLWHITPCCQPIKDLNDWVEQISWNWLNLIDFFIWQYSHYKQKLFSVYLEIHLFKVFFFETNFLTIFSLKFLNKILWNFEWIFPDFFLNSKFILNFEVKFWLNFF